MKPESRHLPALVSTHGFCGMRHHPGLGIPRRTVAPGFRWRSARAT